MKKLIILWADLSRYNQPHFQLHLWSRTHNLTLTKIDCFHSPTLFKKDHINCVNTCAAHILTAGVLEMTKLHVYKWDDDCGESLSDYDRSDHLPEHTHLHVLAVESVCKAQIVISVFGNDPPSIIHLVTTLLNWALLFVYVCQVLFLTGAHAVGSILYRWWWVCIRVCLHMFIFLPQELSSLPSAQSSSPSHCQTDGMQRPFPHWNWLASHSVLVPAKRHARTHTHTQCEWCNIWVTILPKRFHNRHLFSLDVISFFLFCV